MSVCVCVCVCVCVSMKVEGRMGSLRNFSRLASYEVTE